MIDLAGHTAGPPSRTGFSPFEPAFELANTLQIACDRVISIESLTRNPGLGNRATHHEVRQRKNPLHFSPPRSSPLLNLSSIPSPPTPTQPVSAIMSTDSSNPEYPHEPGSFNRVKRLTDRARYDQNSVFEILDAGIVAHVGFIVDGRCMVIPMAYGRVGDVVYIHGYVSGRLLKNLSANPATTLNVTLVDGLVFALGSFHNSMNYRSVNVFGDAEVVTEEKEKEEGLRAVTDHILKGAVASEQSETVGRAVLDLRPNYNSLPSFIVFRSRSHAGRTVVSRPVHAIELKSTTLLKIPIQTASCKIRTGPPSDDKEDEENEELTSRLWTGVVELETKFVGLTVGGKGRGKDESVEALVGTKR